MLNNSEAVCWVDNQFIPASEAKISIFDHGLLYGDGVFEGIRFYNRKPFMLQAHLNRLSDSAQAICLRLPYSESQMSQIVDDLVQRFSAEQGYIRLVVTRGVGSLGISPKSCAQASMFIIADHMQVVDLEKRSHGAKLIVAATRRLPADGLSPRIKSLNYLNHILARMEAENAQADEAIVLNTSGYVAEGSCENVFVVKRGRLLTPVLSDGALAGVTREAIIGLAESGNIAHSECHLTPYDLYTADECFLTGTGAELIPVREIDGRRIVQCPGPVFGQLSAAFDALTQGAAN